MKILSLISIWIVMVFSIVCMISNDLSFTKFKFIDSEEDIKKRIEFYKNETEIITGGKISFEYDDERGTYCQVKSPIFKGEFAIKLPKEYMICGFDIFPFKFELKDVIYNHLNIKYKANLNDTKIKTSRYLLGYRILYEIKANHEKVENYLRKIGKEYYINRFNDKQKLYIETLSKVLYTESMFDEDERKLSEVCGFPVDPASETYEVWSVVEKYFRNHPLKEYVHHWVNDYDIYRLYIGHITSRTFRVELVEYEKLHNKTLLDMPAGGMQKQVLGEITTDYSASCLLPFFDLCNHKNTKDPQESDINAFFLIYKHGISKLAINREVNSGEEFQITYQKDSGNEKLLTSYGFYFKENVLSKVAFKTGLMKSWINNQKYELLKKFNLLEPASQSLYYDRTSSGLPIKIICNKHHLDKNTLDTFRIYVQPNEHFNSTLFEKRIMQNRWISYNNEIFTLSLILYSISKGELSSRLTSFEILNSIQVTKNFYNQNREDIIKNDYLRYKYRLRRKIIYVARENRQIYFKNADMVLDNMSSLFKDQFTKLRNVILKDI